MDIFSPGPTIVESRTSTFRPLPQRRPTLSMSQFRCVSTGAAAAFRMDEIECETEFGAIKLRNGFRGRALFSLTGTKRITVE